MRSGPGRAADAGAAGTPVAVATATRTIEDSMAFTAPDLPVPGIRPVLPASVMRRRPDHTPSSGARGCAIWLHRRPRSTERRVSALTSSQRVAVQRAQLGAAGARRREVELLALGSRVGARVQRR